MGRKKNRATTSVQDEPTTTSAPAPSDTEAPLAMHMQDDGFAFPLGVNAETTSALYYCRSPICPGYTQRASDMPHPLTTCGNILNTGDSSGKREDPTVIERPSPTEPFNLPPDAAAAAVVNESNVQSEDMPQLEPDVVHAEDSPAAADEPLPVPDSVDLPSPIEAMAPLPPVLIVDRNDLERYLFRPSFAPSNILPIMGSVWREPGMSDGHCYEVMGSNPGDGLVLCSCHLPPDSRECLVRLEHFLNGDLCPLSRKPEFVATCVPSRERLSFVVPILEQPERRGLMSSLGLSSWLPIPGTYWAGIDTVYRVTDVDEEVSLPLQNSIGVRVFSSHHPPVDSKLKIGMFFATIEYVSDISDLPVWVTDAGKLVHPERSADGLTLRCDEIATELGVDPSHVERLVDGALATISSVLTFKGVADSSPAADAVIKLISSEKFIHHFRSVLATFNHGVALDVNKVVEYINKTLEPRIDALEQHFGTSEDPTVLEQLGQMRKSFGDHAEGLVKDIEQLKERLDILETLGLAGVEDDVVDEDDDEPPVMVEKPAKKPRIAPETEKQRRRKRDRARRARVAQQEEQLRMRQLRVLGTGPESLDDELPTKNPGGRPKGATLAAGARTKVGKKRKPGAGRPKGSKNKPKPVVSDMAARASVSAWSPKNGAKPLGGGSKASNSFNWGKIVKIPQIVNLLQRIPPSQVDKFREQAKKRLPDLRLTPWNSNEQGRFAQWYFNNPGALA